MKLGELKSAIRKMKGSPFVRVTLGPGIPPMNVQPQKTPLLATLDMAFPDGKSQETGLSFDESNGMIFCEAGEAQSLLRNAAAEVPDDDYVELDHYSQAGMQPEKVVIRRTAIGDLSVDDLKIADDPDADDLLV